MKCVVVCAGFHLEAHEESPGVLGGKLLGLRDVSRGLDNRSTHGVHDAGFVVADESDDEVKKGALHPSSLEFARASLGRSQRLAIDWRCATGVMMDNHRGA